MAVTIKDIAERVGKSVTTVSRALHGYDDVSAETKALVQRIADEMGYTPNILAQRLQKQSTETIGVILPTFGPRFSDPFFSEFLAGIGNKASEIGYDMLVSTRAPGEEEMQAYRRIVQGGRVDGLVVLRTRRIDTRIQYLCEKKFPFIAFGRTEDGCDFPYVDEDGEYGMQLITEHLIKLGHKRIACIAPSLELMFAHHRLKGLRTSLQKQGIHLSEDCIKIGDLTQNGGYKQARKLLDLPDPPTAIAACNDLMALGAISAAQDIGLNVGEEIAITGFDDIPMSEHSHPPLTTVHQPVYKIGTMVCEMLIQIVLGNPLEKHQIILKPSLMVRQSCGNGIN
ncbi:MAG: LacI family DNA-binding transcriptional regulator [Anaerolineales bacterium]